MCLPGGPEVAVDAEVNLHGSTLEPDTTTNDEMLGLRSLGNTQKAGVEATRLLFFSRGHRQLNVVQTDDCHSGLLSRPVAASRCSQHSKAVRSPPTWTARRISMVDRPSCASSKRRTRGRRGRFASM